VCQSFRDPYWFGSFIAHNGARLPLLFAQFEGTLYKTKQKVLIMDKLDRQLIAQLRHNGRAGFSELASALGVSRATVRARMDRLQTTGEIVGFSVVTRGDRQIAPIRGMMMIGIEGRGADRIIRQLRGFSEITEIHTTNGKWDLIVLISSETLEKLDQVLSGIRRIEGVTTSETNLLLATKVAS
jgi:DNA-binding Lrp family transcriptional regulator